jgi:hypothetical protein
MTITSPSARRTRLSLGWADVVDLQRPFLGLSYAKGRSMRKSEFQRLHASMQAQCQRLLAFFFGLLQNNSNWLAKMDQTSQ